MQKKHPQVIEQGKKIDISDLFADPLLVYQRFVTVVDSVLRPGALDRLSFLETTGHLYKSLFPSFRPWLFLIDAILGF